jgi:hypothetical protein
MLATIAERQRRPENSLWRKFEFARPLGALLDAAVHGLQMLPQMRLNRLPRMADFALWATACKSAFRRVRTFESVYSKNRCEAIENIIDGDPVAACVREIMADRARWAGTASDRLQAGTNIASELTVSNSTGQRAPAHSLAGYAELRAFSGHLE